MEIKDRMLAYIKHKGIRPAEFERNAGLSNAYVQNLKNSIGADKLKSIASYYTDLNLEWLITGEGEMLKLPSSTESPATINSHNANSHNANSHINDGGTIDRLLALLEEKDRQINQLLQIISGLSK